jgi:hypothetical protein
MGVLSSKQGPDTELYFERLYEQWFLIGQEPELLRHGGTGLCHVYHFPTSNLAGKSLVL